MRVLIVDDSVRMRDLWRRILQEDDEIAVVAEASNGQDAVDKVREVMPDVVVMDVEMPVMDGIEATRTIKRHWPDVAVIGCTAFHDTKTEQAMSRAGASACIEKISTERLLISLVKAVTTRTVWLDEPADDPARGPKEKGPP